MRKQEPHRLFDNLLTRALIGCEAVSECSQFGEALMDRDPALGKLHSGLLAAEARHFARYVELAELYFGQSRSPARGLRRWQRFTSPK